MVLRRKVDAVVQLLAHQHVRRRVRRDDVRERRRPVVDRRHLDGVVVGVGCSGDLPHSKSFVIRLSRAVIAEPTAADQVRLGDDRDQRHPQIGAKRDRLRRVALQHVEDRTAVQRSGGPETRMHQETVENPRKRIDGVDIRRQKQCRLRLTECDDMLGAQPSQDVGASRQSPGVGEDVIRVRVAGVMQRRIPLRVLIFQRHVDTHEVVAAFDAHALRRHRDVGVTGTHHLAVRHHPDGGRVDAAADIEPLDDHGSVESVGLRGAEHHDPGGVVRGGRRCDTPPSVPPESGCGRIGRRRSGDEELLCDVSHTRDVEGSQKQCGVAWNRPVSRRIAAGRHMRIIKPGFGPAGANGTGIRVLLG